MDILWTFIENFGKFKENFGKSTENFGEFIDNVRMKFLNNFEKKNYKFFKNVLPNFAKFVENF